MKRKIFSSGQTLLEFALILPMLLVLMLGFFDLGRGLFYYSSLSNAVREGARAGIVVPFNEEYIQDVVLQYAFALTNTSEPLTRADIKPVTITPEGLDESLQVTATYCFVPVTPFIAQLVGSGCESGESFELTAIAIMRKELRID